jgi:hypothetical protein
MIGEVLSREVAGALHTDVSASAQCDGLTSAAASANLGAFMRISGETEAAESLLRATIAREPDNAAVDDRRGAATSPDHASAPPPRISR